MLGPAGGGSRAVPARAAQRGDLLTQAGTRISIRRLLVWCLHGDRALRMRPVGATGGLLSRRHRAIFVAVLALAALFAGTSFVACSKDEVYRLDVSFMLTPEDLDGAWVSLVPQLIDPEGSGPAGPCTSRNYRLVQLERDAALKLQQLVRAGIPDARECMKAYPDSFAAAGPTKLPSFGVGDEDAVYAFRNEAGRTTLTILIRVENAVTWLDLSYDPDLREARAIAEAAAQKIRAALAAER